MRPETKLDKHAERTAKERNMIFRPVAHYDARAKRSRDLFGIIDALCFGEDENGPFTLALQITGPSNVSARVNKLKDSLMAGAVMLAGWRLEVWGIEMESGKLTKVVDMFDHLAEIQGLDQFWPYEE